MINNIRITASKYFFVRVAAISTLFVSGCAGINTGGSLDNKYMLTPMAGSEIMPHPLYGTGLPVESKDAYYAIKENNGLKVFFRMNAATKGNESKTTFMVLFKNLDSHNPVTIKPVIDVIDGNGQVRHVEDYKGLLAIAKAASNTRSQGGSFFAYGDQKFVTSAVTGYAVGSVLSEMVASSQRGYASKIVQVIEQHWIKDEYRIPPQSYVDGIALLNGMPLLPTKVRITIGDKLFVFDSVANLGEAESNYKAMQKL